jgi:glycosidase
MILLWFANINPAFSPFKELFNDHHLREQSPYQSVIDTLQEFFKTERPAGPGGQSIFELLRAPILASPHSLAGQLSYIRRHWGMLLSRSVLDKMAGAGDLIKEESKTVFAGATPETVVPRYSRVSPFGEIDDERFTADLEWMPNVVMIAKNTYVWLDQLARKYQRSIRTLDQIPDEELTQLARWKINALWLIGIWERSVASQKIKQMMGNPEAVASAYSIFDYEVAGDLGGEEAFQNLRMRAWQQGIRLAGDMVPNHVGIYSKWVIEHPEYFVQSAYSPFPNYSFTGPNLSAHPVVEIRLEDGYWTRRDAAVVFQRIDRSTGDTRYIYHGNDGTHTPWNDTAQLDFLKPEVREAVIGAIFHVARKFSVIRFDAAMVLTKQHFQRLWYPQPGSGGDIPSRADHAMIKEDFDRQVPNEFWREVVDRINSELPNTLLLAEAFWLLEGYFVRTLGMHRVYNSAFMNMMMKEENAKYRELIANTLSFNPQILKRYVNFMSNPDERTAVEQFGKDDKYFGIAVMMITLPGLPMFAHGQIEGFTEKYGMEYRRAYYDETPDRSLVERHEREVFPILEKRWLFSEVGGFELYEFHDLNGNVNDNVICYSNRAAEARMLFCYNNKYEAATGTIGRSVAKVQSDGGASSGRSVGDALGLSADERHFYILREHRSRLLFLRSGKELCGPAMFLSLRGFEYQLFLDFKEVIDNEGDVASLAGWLEGRAVPDIDQSLREMKLVPLHAAFRELIGENMLSQVDRLWFGTTPRPAERKGIFERIAMNRRTIIREAARFCRMADSTAGLSHEEFINDLTAAEQFLKARPDGEFHAGQSIRRETPESRNRAVFLLFTWILCRRLSTVCGGRQVLDHFLMGKVIRHERDLQLLGVMISFERVFSDVVEMKSLVPLAVMFDDPRVRALVGVNTYEGVEYFSKENFEELIEWLSIVAGIGEIAKVGTLQQEPDQQKLVSDVCRQLKQLGARSGYRMKDLRQYLNASRSPSESKVPAG